MHIGPTCIFWANLTPYSRSQLRVVGCGRADLAALCAAEEPALVVLDETLDSFALYYQASDAGVVAFYERASGNLTLASCDIDGATK